MRTMKGLGALAVAALTAWIFLAPAIGAWALAGAEFAFLAWVARELRKAASKSIRAREPLEGDEAEIVQRYPLYFQRPALARECASTLAALGLASLVAVPWLTYKLAWLPAILIGVQLFAVARLTKLLSPIHTLRLATAKGDRDALRLLSAHDGAMRKVSAPDQPGA
jgi:hypothetical protein